MTDRARIRLPSERRLNGGLDLSYEFNHFLGAKGQLLEGIEGV